MANEGVVAGKVAIVTGGGGGIGRATALQMAKEGAKVVVVDIGAAMDGSGGSAGPAEKVVAEIKAQGGEAMASTLSITKPENAQAIIDATVAAYGRVDILVNNAGILRDRMVFKMSISDWDDVIDVHLNGSFYMARACVPHFKEQMGGSVELESAVGKGSIFTVTLPVRMAEQPSLTPAKPMLENASLVKAV